MREPCAMTSQLTIIAYPERKDVPADSFVLLIVLTVSRHFPSSYRGRRASRVSVF